MAFQSAIALFAFCRVKTLLAEHGGQALTGPLSLPFSSKPFRAAPEKRTREYSRALPSLQLSGPQSAQRPAVMMAME